MITQQDAEVIAAHYLGRPPEDGSQPWHLREFEHGWLIVKPAPPGQERWRGGSNQVIERESGRLLQFPSAISRQSIVEDYPGVKRWGGEVRSGD